MQTRQKEKRLNSNRHYSLRKLSVGLASVLIGISFLNGTKTTVNADTITASTKTGEVSKAGNLEVADDSKDLSAFSMSFNGKNGENETAKADTTSDQTTQAEAQENRLVDQINYKLTNNGSTDSKEDLGQNLTVPDETKQVPTTKSDAEKNITGSSADQHVNNQLNDHAENNSQTQNEQKLDLIKNSKKFAKKVLATNLIATPPMTNGGFDEATWGKFDINNWHGSIQDGVYQLTGYTGDEIHIIVPNEADFEQAGRSTNGLQVGITRDTVQSLLTNYGSNYTPKTIAFSKTNDQKVKAIGTDWSHAFSRSAITNFDGSNLDVSGVTNMNSMFGDMFRDNRINDLSSLANWDISKVTDMSNMFNNNEISDLRPLSNWDTSNVINMSGMFRGNKISDLTPLSNWKTGKVTDMSYMFGSMFERNKVSDLTPLANWNVSNVTNMSEMFEGNKVSDLTPLVNWDVSNVTNMSEMFEGNSISNLASLTNWKISNVTDMSSMFARNSISDLSPLTNWSVNNVTDMRGMFARNSISDLSPLTNWSVNNVTDMRGMFSDNKISDLTPLTNWDVSNVTNMSGMFDNSKREYMPDGSVVFIDGNKISDLAPLANWNIGKVTNMSEMFARNSISDLTPLANWNIGKVTNMGAMFASNKISDLTPLANWDISKVINMRGMFAQNPYIKDLKPIANRDMRSVAIKDLDGIFSGDTQLDLTNINNTQFMQDFVKLKEKVKNTYVLRNVFRKVLQGTTFITNNADLVEVIMGKDMDQELPVFTNTATRTIVFNFPDGTSKTITQHIYYKTIAPVQIEWPVPTFVSVSHIAVIRPVIRSIVQNPVAAIPRIIKTYTIEDVKASDWQLDDSKQNDDVIIDGVICFKPVQIPRIDGYKAYLMKDPVNPAMFLVSFVALPQQLQNNQSNYVQLPQKPAQPEQKQPEQKQPEQKQPEQKQPEQKQPEQKQPDQKQSEQKQSEQKQSEQKQSEQKQSEQKQSEQKQSEQKPAQPIQTRSADAKQVDQIIDHISYVLMHNDSTFDNVNSFEPVQDDSASLEASSDSTQKDDAVKIVNTVKPKKHIVKKHVTKKRKKHVKKYHLKRRSRKHAKKRVIKYKKHASKKFRRFHLKRIKRVKH